MSNNDVVARNEAAAEMVDAANSDDNVVDVDASLWLVESLCHKAEKYVCSSKHTLYSRLMLLQNCLQAFGFVCCSLNTDDRQTDRQTGKR